MFKQKDSQVDASWKLGSSCNFVSPGLACTCVDLRWLGLTLVKIKFARKSTQVFHDLSKYPTQVKASCVKSINLLLAMKYRISVCLEIGFYATCEYLAGILRVRLATQRKSRPKFNLRLLATSWDFVWPGPNNKYIMASCRSCDWSVERRK